MLASKVGSYAARTWSSVTGVKPFYKNKNGARRAYPGKGALQILQSRRKAIKTIQKISGTMKLIAQAQLTSVVKQANATAPFFENIKAIYEQLPGGFKMTVVRAEKEKKGDEAAAAAAAAELAEKIAAEEAAKDTRLHMAVVVTSNRGLCGSLNTQLLRDCFKSPIFNKSDIFVFGEKGSVILEKRAAYKERVVGSASPKKIPTFIDFGLVAEGIAAQKYDIADFTFNKLVTNNIYAFSSIALPAPNQIEPKLAELPYDIDDSPSIQLQNFNEFALAATLHYTFYQNAASETISRVAAMDGANKSCKELLVKLTIVFNKLRQSLITTDLIEITTGTTAVEETA